MDWNLLLFVTKWILIGLIYAVLFLLLFGVFREMSQRLQGSSATGRLSYGRLRVLQPGKDPKIRPGSIFHLSVETRLGAEPDNEIVLSDPFVSSHHARLKWDGTSWWVEDLNSRNGTKVDQKRCLPHHPQPLPAGATLEIGDVRFEVLV